MSNKNEQWNLAFTGISSISALIITLLALWGIFFTSLPEKILSEYRTEIKKTKDEIVELRQEKRLIQKQNNEIKAENNKQKANNESLGMILNNLKLKHSSLLTKVRNYKKKERSRQDKQYSEIVDSYMQRLRAQLKERKKDALHLSNFNKIIEWYKSEPLESAYKERSEWRKKSPLDITYIVFSIQDASPFGNTKESLETYREFIKYRFFKEKNQTLGYLIETILLSAKPNKPDKTENSAYEMLKNKIQKFLNKNKGKLNIYIEPIIYSSSSDEEFITAGIEALKKIETSELLILDLEVELYEW